MECSGQEGYVEEGQGVLGEAEEGQAVGVGPGSGHSRPTLTPSGRVTAFDPC